MNLLNREHGKLLNNPFGMSIIDPRLSTVEKKLISEEFIKVDVDEKELQVYTNDDTREVRKPRKWDEETNHCCIASRVSYSSTVEITINARKICNLQEQALIHLSKAYELFPVIYYLIPLVRARLSKGDVKTALHLVANHCNRFPKEVHAWVQLGDLITHFSVNKNSLATKCFQIAKNLSSPSQNKP